MRAAFWLSALQTLAVSVAAAPSAATDLTFDYIVIGSGAGGGPVAARLARSGFKTLLIESGDDQGTNPNVTVPGFQGLVSSDKQIRWDNYVNHYKDFNRAKKDPKYVYQLPNGDRYVGLNPPPGAKPLGINYPRAGTLGGCVSHNALIWITPHQSDWDNIATLTGDQSWKATNMNQYLAKVYEWQPTEPTDPSILVRDTALVKHLAGGAEAIGVPIPYAGAIEGLGNALLNNPNYPTPNRDSTQGFFNIPLIMNQGVRTSVRDWVVATAQSYPLTIRLNCFVTKLIYDPSASTPTVIGVEFLDGPHLYRASPLSGAAGTPGKAMANKEVILSAGAFNTPQLLKLNGIGPAAELQKFGIKVVSNLPGVGTNMQDRYEIPVNVIHGQDFPILNNCTFDQKDHDLCYKQWQTQPFVAGQKGVYASDGLAAAMVVRSKSASTSDIDLFVFGGPVNFIGYFPYWGDYAIKDHKHFSWYTLKAHTRNRAGTVELNSTDPLDTPIINFNYFDTGTTAGGADQLDLNAMIEAVKLSRTALNDYHHFDPFLPGDNFTEQNPGPQVQTDEQIGNYIKERAWGHHASCTAAIGADNDPNAVIDSKFRVRGVKNLRVVDASAFPRIPGVFIQAPIFMIAEKAADVIANNL